MRKMKKKQGFTLIELLIAVAIVGILAGIAYPTYATHTLKVKRSEAQSILLSLANKQEMYYLDHHTYANNLATQLGLNANPFITENAYYSISTSSVIGTADFTLQATAINSQANDEECTKLTITHELAKSGLTQSGDVVNNCWK